MSLKSLFQIILVSLTTPSIIFATGLSGHAWSSNIGWIKFAGPGYGVTMSADGSNFSGYAWSSNIGWIKFNGLEARACAGTANANCSGGTHPNAGGWDGRISLRGATYGVSPDAENCHVGGWAWGGDVVGWIHFSGPGYGVSIDGCAPVAAIDPPQCSFSAAPTTIPRGARTTLSWNCNGTADSCLIVAAAAEGLPPTGSLRTEPLMRTTQFTLACDNAGGRSVFLTEVRVVRPAYCEVIPFVGGCR